MANGRFVAKSIAYDDRLNSLSLHAHFLYLQTVPHLDRDGLADGNPAVLRSVCVPARPEYTDGLVATCIQEWIDVELVDAYPSGRGRALHFHGFAKNQVGLRYDREPRSRFDCPPGYMRTPAGIVQDLRQTPGGAPDLSRTLTNRSISRSEVEVEVEVEEKPQPCPFGGAGGAGAGLTSSAPVAVEDLDPEPEPAGLTAPDPAAVALLTDTRIGIEPPQAAWAARNFSFADIRAQCVRFERERAKGKAQGPGVIIARLRNGWPAEITDADMERSAILETHRAPGDADLERQRRRERYAVPGVSWQ